VSLLLSHGWLPCLDLGWCEFSTPPYPGMTYLWWKTTRLSGNPGGAVRTQDVAQSHTVASTKMFDAPLWLLVSNHSRVLRRWSRDCVTQTNKKVRKAINCTTWDVPAWRELRRLISRLNGSMDGKPSACSGCKPWCFAELYGTNYGGT